MIECELEDIKSTGNFFTLNDEQQGNVRVFSKLARMLANQAWQDIYSYPEICF